MILRVASRHYTDVPNLSALASTLNATPRSCYREHAPRKLNFQVSQEKENRSNSAKDSPASSQPSVQCLEVFQPIPAFGTIAVRVVSFRLDLYYQYVFFISEFYEEVRIEVLIRDVSNGCFSRLV